MQLNHTQLHSWRVSLHSQACFHCSHAQQATFELVLAQLSKILSAVSVVQTCQPIQCDVPAANFKSGENHTSSCAETAVPEFFGISCTESSCRSNSGADGKQATERMDFSSAISESASDVISAETKGTSSVYSQMPKAMQDPGSRQAVSRAGDAASLESPSGDPLGAGILEQEKVPAVDSVVDASAEVEVAQGTAASEQEDQSVSVLELPVQTDVITGTTAVNTE